MFKIVDEHVFPFLRTLGGEGSAFSEHMKDARLGIPTPALLAKAVEKLDEVQMDDRDTKGDVYEYMLGKIATAGQNGQFRTPRHIIALMVELTEPKPTDTICDPAAGTCGFLVAAGEYLRREHPEVLRDPKLRQHFHDNNVQRVRFRPDDAAHRLDEHDPARRRAGAHRLSRFPCRGTQRRRRPLQPGACQSALCRDRSITRRRRRICSRSSRRRRPNCYSSRCSSDCLKVGGRAAVIVPDGVLFGSSKAHQELRRMLVEDHKLDAVIKLPSGVFRPYAGVSTAILVFTKTGVGGTDHVWFYDMQADGYSLDDKRIALASGREARRCPTRVAYRQ